MRIPSVAPFDRDLRSGLLVTEEDCQPETLDVPREMITAVAGLVCTHSRLPLPVGERPVAFVDGAVSDAMGRAAAWFECQAAMLLQREAGDALGRWIRDHGIRQVVTAYAPVGPTRERLEMLKARLAGLGVSLIPVRRAWDEVFWAHAIKGFFPFKDRIPRLLGELSHIEV